MYRIVSYRIASYRMVVLFLVTRAATAYAGVDMHVDSTVYVF